MKEKQKMIKKADRKMKRNGKKNYESIEMEKKRKM